MTPKLLTFDMDDWQRTATNPHSGSHPSLLPHYFTGFTDWKKSACMGQLLTLDRQELKLWIYEYSKWF